MMANTVKDQTTIQIYTAKFMLVIHTPYSLHHLLLILVP